jgi:hypothetical protein
MKSRGFELTTTRLVNRRVGNRLRTMDLQETVLRASDVVASSACRMLTI